MYAPVVVCAPSSSCLLLKANDNLSLFSSRASSCLLLKANKNLLPFSSRASSCSAANERLTINAAPLSTGNSFVSDKILTIHKGRTMSYKKCPKCGLNYITENEEVCSVCKPKNTDSIVTKSITTDFSHIVRGCIYGNNSRKIYERFCDSLGWDRNKEVFTYMRLSYAENADRVNDVWFIFYPNYDAGQLNNFVNGLYVDNFIQNNGDRIFDVGDIGKSNNANRITFVKTKNGYEFFGVYKIIESGTTRVYQRISDVYPVE